MGWGGGGGGGGDMRKRGHEEARPLEGVCLPAVIQSSKH